MAEHFNKKSKRKLGRVHYLPVYNAILKRVHFDMGHADSTSNTELEAMLDHYGLRPYEVGPSGLMHARTAESPKYAIYNTAAAPPGEHWICFYGDYMYDPLGEDSSGSQEQPDEADDCGQRCVAYLLLCKRTRTAIPL